jgi:hypothetical protein
LRFIWRATQSPTPTARRRYAQELKFHEFAVARSGVNPLRDNHYVRGYPAIRNFR